jgi:hypothetical protein
MEEQKQKAANAAAIETNETSGHPMRRAATSSLQ